MPAKGKVGFLGQVEAIFDGSCAVDPFLLVYSSYANLFKMFTSAIEPSWKQEVEWATGKSWLHNTRQALKDAAVHDPLYKNPGVSFLFDLSVGIDTAAYFVWLADLASTFLINWASQVYQLAGCEDRFSFYSAYSKQASGGFTANGNWNSAGDWVISYDSIFAPVWELGMSLRAQDSGDIMACIHGEDFFGTQGPFSVRLADTTWGTTYATSTNKELGSGKWSENMVSWTNLHGIGGGSDIQVQCNAPAGWAYENTVFVTGVVYGRLRLGPDDGGGLIVPRRGLITRFRA